MSTYVSDPRFITEDGILSSIAYGQVVGLSFTERNDNPITLSNPVCCDIFFEGGLHTWYDCFNESDYELLIDTAHSLDYIGRELQPDTGTVLISFGQVEEKTPTCTLA